MKNKLPKIFANKIDKKIKNNEEIYTTSKINKNIKSKEENLEKFTVDKQQKNKTINKKINEILKTNKYIYKVPVKIELKDRQVVTNIIGKNNKNIITMNNELIKIDEIKNIEVYEKNE